MNIFVLSLFRRMMKVLLIFLGHKYSTVKMNKYAAQCGLIVWVFVFIIRYVFERIPL